MSELHSVLSPVFPAEKDLDLPSDAKPVAHTSSIEVFVELAEPVIFLQGFESQHLSDKPPSILRGSLIVRVLKPTKLKTIFLSFKGYSRTDWPEGIPPRKQEFVEINDIVNHTWPFYDSETEQQVDNNNNNNNVEDRKFGRTSSSSSFSLHTDHSGLKQSSDEMYKFILQESGASVYKPMNGTSHEIRHPVTTSTSTSTSTTTTTPESNRRQSRANERRADIANKTTPPSSKKSNGSALTGNWRSLSPLNLMKRATSPNPTNDNSRPSRSSTSSSLLSDLLGTSFPDPPSISGSRSKTTPYNNSTSHNNEAFVFQPGEYLYPFEQVIPSSYPETIQAEFGFVEYNLTVTIERQGAFKSNITAKIPIKLVRTPSDTSVEESEPIAISRDWENHLHYEIIIASKDIILDAFLPISFHFCPIDKVTLHRIRIYLTETMEYYCKGKKVHRVEPTRKFLLAEQNGPRLDNLTQDENSSKTKNLGNLLVDESNGDLVNKDFEFQVFIPNKFKSHQQLHPDTAFDKIKSNHWIKLCLRLSRWIDGKRKHYEIVIDSPIHVLHKLCSHANTLLPSYENHAFTAEQISLLEDQINASNVTQDDNLPYHKSNIFFPKEILLSPIVSPDVHALGYKMPQAERHSRNSDHSSRSQDDAVVFGLPALKSNIYQPDSIQKELASPQAMPLSPVSSPSIRPISLSMLDTPPAFDFSDDPLDITDANPPKNPPSYNDVMQTDGVNMQRALSLPLSTKSLLNKPLERMSQNSKKEKRPNSNLSNHFSEDISDDTSDVLSARSLPYSVNSVSTVPHSALHSTPHRIRNVGNDSRNTLRTNMQDILPSTLRYQNSSFNDLNELLSGDDDENEDDGNAVNSANSGLYSTKSTTSSLDNSYRENLEEGTFTEPLLHSTTQENRQSIDDSFNRSKDSITDLLESPRESSVDITALYNNSANAWHPLRDDSETSLQPTISPKYSFGFANNNHVLNDFKQAFHRHAEEDVQRVGSVDSIRTLHKATNKDYNEGSSQSTDSSCDLRLKQALTKQNQETLIEGQISEAR